MFFILLYHRFRGIYRKILIGSKKDIVADDGGRARFKGFYGNYDITVHADGREITVPAHLEKYTGNPLVFTVKI